MVLISSFLAFDITFWNQWRKPSMKQQEVYQSYISNVFISIQYTALCDQSNFNQLLHWQGLNSSLNLEEASQKDGGKGTASVWPWFLALLPPEVCCHLRGAAPAGAQSHGKGWAWSSQLVMLPTAWNQEFFRNFQTRCQKWQPFRSLRSGKRVLLFPHVMNC